MSPIAPKRNSFAAKCNKQLSATWVSEGIVYNLSRLHGSEHFRVCQEFHIQRDMQTSNLDYTYDSKYSKLQSL